MNGFIAAAFVFVLLLVAVAIVHAQKLLWKKRAQDAEAHLQRAQEKIRHMHHSHLESGKKLEQAEHEVIKLRNQVQQMSRR